MYTENSAVKGKGGRPKGSRNSMERATLVSFRILPEMLERISAYGVQAGILSNTAILRTLLERGLDAVGTQARPPETLQTIARKPAPKKDNVQASTLVIKPPPVKKAIPFKEPEGWANMRADEKAASRAVIDRVSDKDRAKLLAGLHGFMSDEGQALWNAARKSA